MLKKIILPLAIFWVSPTLADTQVSPLVLKQNIEQAIQLFEQTKPSQWAFTLTRYENEEGDIQRSVEQYNPSLPVSKQWRLLSLDGQPATKEQNVAFSEKKYQQRKEQHNFSIKLRELIQLDSLQLESEGQGELKARFAVYLEKLGQKASNKLTGVLTYNRELAFISQVEITNTAEFSPVLTANITDFNMKFSFTKLEQWVLPLQYDLAMRGTFAFFTQIEETSKDSFSDYRYVLAEGEDNVSQ